MTRWKWEESQANAADRDDRVQSVQNRVYSIIYRCSISVQFVGVQLLLLRVNHACKACTASIAVAVGSNVDEPLEAAVVELSGLPVVHCSSLTGLLESWSVACSSVCWSGCCSVARASLVHRWSICWSGCCSVARASLVHHWSVCWSGCCSVARASLVHRWSIARLSVRLAVPLSLVHCASVCSTRRSCIAGPSLVFQLVHRWSICWCIAHPSVPLSLVHRASLWLLLCPSCIADASLMRRSSACLCTARPSACAPLVRLMVRLLESRSLLHRWVEGYRTSGRRGCSFGVAGDGIVKACSMESNGGSERKTACWRKGKRCWHVQEGLFVTEREWRLMLRLGWRESVRGIGIE